MEESYADLIVKGQRAFWEVPNEIKYKVKEILIKWNRGDLSLDQISAILLTGVAYLPAFAAWSVFETHSGAAVNAGG